MSSSAAELSSIPPSQQAREGISNAHHHPGHRRTVHRRFRPRGHPRRDIRDPRGKWRQDNRFTRRHLIATLVTAPAGSTFADGEPTPFVVVSVRNPTVSLATDDRRERFVATVTDVVLKAAGMELE